MTARGPTHTVIIYDSINLNSMNYIKPLDFVAHFKTASNIPIVDSERIKSTNNITRARPCRVERVTKKE